MAVPLEQDIKRQGLNQVDLVKFCENVRDLVNEMRTDLNALRADVVSLRGNYNSMHVSLITAGPLVGTYAAAALTSTSTTGSALTLNKG